MCNCSKYLLKRRKRTKTKPNQTSSPAKSELQAAVWIEIAPIS